MTAGRFADVLSVRHELDYQALDEDVFRLRDQVGIGAEVALRTDDAAEVAAALSVLDGWAGRVHLLPMGVEAAVGVIESEQFVSGLSPAQHGAAAVPCSGVSTRWVVYTSGTTGTPKPVEHTLTSLSRTVRTGALGHRVWGLLYDPNRMAGLQVILQAMRTRARLVAPDAHLSLADRVGALRGGSVDSLSATPTLWRQILQVPGVEEWSLSQITLGGEIADQTVLTALAKKFPDSRIVHVFASTETGAAFSVTDGREGFPIRYLSDPPRGISLDVRENILYVHAPGVSLAGSDGFVSTGDRVEVVDDRVLFRGRETGVVNIGGANVWPEEVETLLRRHSDVAEAVVSSRQNALSGNLLVARVVLAPEAERTGVAKRLRSWVRGNAPGTHVPAMIDVVEELDVSATGKAQR